MVRPFGYAGLKLSTCALSGLPRVPRRAAKYTVTAKGVPHLQEELMTGSKREFYTFTTNKRHRVKV